VVSPECVRRERRSKKQRGMTGGEKSAQSHGVREQRRARVLKVTPNSIYTEPKPEERSNAGARGSVRTRGIKVNRTKRRLS